MPWKGLYLYLPESSKKAPSFNPILSAMHLKQQHISGKANGPECIALSSVQGRRYMVRHSIFGDLLPLTRHGADASKPPLSTQVYGSDKFVIVYTDEFAHVQTFDGATQAPVAGADNTQEAHELTSVSMCPGSGYVGCSLRNVVTAIRKMSKLVFSHRGLSFSFAIR